MGPSFGLLELFHIDQLSYIMMGLIGFVGAVVFSFSLNYLQGSKNYFRFLITLGLLLLSVCTMVCADNSILFSSTWFIANLFLIKLMAHKRRWQAARQSSLLAAKKLGLGFMNLAVSLFLLYRLTGSTSIHTVIYSDIHPQLLVIPLLALSLAAVIQSALFPFHKWIISSLNSPTPTSAMMHAGLVNGGGFLLVRFAPLLLKNPFIMHFLFGLGIVSVLVGTSLKLVQNSIKPMLASSTISQMGFMVAQCGLGLFPAAVAHLCWHGLFKAYLFLDSGSILRQKKVSLEWPPNLSSFILALLCGTVGTFCFAWSAGYQLFPLNGTVVVLTVAFIGITQFALPFINNIIGALLASSFVGFLYGVSVFAIEIILEPLQINQPVQFNFLHLAGIILLSASWIFFLFKPLWQKSSWFKPWYIRLVNAAQPDPKTVTFHRSYYDH
jgi:NAD(P)H-quinone oxidoreductase subunit 5